MLEYEMYNEEKLKNDNLTKEKSYNSNKNINILKDAQDIVIIKKIEYLDNIHRKKERYVFAVKPSKEVMKQFYEESLKDNDLRKRTEFGGCWYWGKKKGLNGKEEKDGDDWIRGSSTYLALMFDKIVLREKGFWLPGPLEALVIKEQNKLKENEYMDLGIMVFGKDNPNISVAESLMNNADSMGLATPLMIPFRDLNYNPKPEINKLLKISMVSDYKGTIRGSAAISLLYSNFNHIKHVDRGAIRIWIGNSYGIHVGTLTESNENGTISWICGESDKETLITKYIQIIKKDKEDKIKKIEDEYQMKLGTFKISLGINLQTELEKDRSIKRKRTIKKIK